jgi:putative sterol carrier protein
MAVNEVIQAWVERAGEHFHPERAGSMDAVFQFSITGEDGGKWYATIKDKTFEIVEGEAEAPKVTIVCSVENFCRLVTRKIDAESLYSMGRLQIKGPLYLAQRFAYIVS